MDSYNSYHSNLMENNIQMAVPVNSREIVQRDALSIASQHKRCGLGISMGVGKTRIAIRHMILNFNPFVSYLVVVPKHSVKESWIEEFKKMEANEKISRIL